MPNIALVWDFDGTLTPQDSTTKVVEKLQGKPGMGGQFWSDVKSLKGDNKTGTTWEHVLAMDAPIWMYSLSRLAALKKVPLNKQFFRKFILPDIEPYHGAIDFLRSIKKLEKDHSFKKLDIKIHHFIITAGLKELVEQVFPSHVISWTFGCRYAVVAHPSHPDEPESIPVFCMDETVKTRSLYEISKGAFCNENIKVNTRVEKSNLWVPFENIIYIGDGDTDIPALSLVRSKGGLGVAVYDPKKSKQEVQKRHHTMRLDKRADFITQANFSLEGDLFKYIQTRCVQIRQRYEAERLGYLPRKKNK